MTILDVRPDAATTDGNAVGGGAHQRSQDALITDSGAVMPPVSDLGAGRGPSWLDGWLRENLVDLLAWRRSIHAHPELSRQEYGTTELIMGLLHSIGLEPEVLPGGTGVICDIGGRDMDGGADDDPDAPSVPCVALRADIDALPLPDRSSLPCASTVEGVAHACGHDIHTAALLGAAHALACAPELPGKVRLIFQPAEEVMPGGALDVIAAGGLNGVDRIFGLHCSPGIEVGKVGTVTGAITSATDLLELRLSSPGGHTSRPHLTGDLVHALSTLATGLPAVLSRRIDPRAGTVLVWGAVHAGEAANAVPQEGLLRGTLRTGDRQVWRDLEPLVADLVPALAAPTGVAVDLRHSRGVPPVVNDEASTGMMRSGVLGALGEDGLACAEQSSGGEDFAWYLEQVPGSYARLGVASGEGPHGDIHQPTFAADERALPIAVRVFVGAALAALS